MGWQPDSELPLRSRIADLRRQLVEAEAALANSSTVSFDLPATDSSPVAGVGKSSEELFRLIFEWSSIGTAILDDVGRCWLFNQAFCDIFGEPAAKVSSAHFLDLVQPDDQDAVRTDLKLPPGEIRVVERRLQHPRMGEFWGSLRLSTMVFNDLPAPVRVCQVEDVTAKRLGQVAEAQERHLLAHLITVAPIGVALLDTSMRYLAHSDPWLKVHNKVGETIIGRSHYEVVPEIPERWRQIHRRCLAGEKIKADEDFCAATDGENCYFRWSIQPWKTARGRNAGIMIVADRIDDLVLARRQVVESAQLKAALFSNMSHEIRTPVYGVLGTVELLLETDLSREQQDLASTIFDRGQTLLSMINTNFDHARAASDQLAPESSRFNLLTLLEEVVATQFPAAESRDLTLSCDFPADLPEWYEGDPGRIRLILEYLVQHTIQSTIAGEVWISSRAANLNDRAGATDRPFLLHLTVHSTQTEIDNHHPAINDLTGSPQPRNEVEPALSASRGLAHDLGGSITATSEPGQQTTLRVELPLGRRPDPTPASATEIRRPLVGTTILVADSNASVRTSLRSRLEAWGGEVIEAEFARDALLLIAPLLAKKQPVILLIAEQLVAIDPRASRELGEFSKLAVVPVVAITKLPGVRPAFLPGCLPVTRPIRSGDLLATIQEAIQSITDRPESAMPAAADDQVIVGANLVGVRVLLAEDNETNQKVAGKMLKRLGCEFEVVANGVDVLSKLDRADFDLILMDVQMPRLDGYQTTQAIRHRERAQPGARHLPIIAMTANAMQGDRERCLAAEMDDYLSKPVTIDKLAEVLGQWTTPLAAKPAVSSPSILRLSRLLELSQGDVEFEEELLDCLITDLANGMNRLQAALEPLDSLRIANTLHGMVGACRTVGADDFGTYCRDREDQSKEPGFQPDAAWFPAIERKRDDLIAAIANHLRR